MKKICASTFSPHGICGSKTRARLMGVLPSVGATRMTTAVKAPNTGMMIQKRAAGVIERLG
jgi:hypothetical protein